MVYIIFHELVSSINAQKTRLLYQTQRSRSSLLLLFFEVIACLFVTEISNLQANPVNGQKLIIINRQEILQAMQKQTGYDPTAITNVARFQAAVILQLVRQAQARNPSGPPLLISHEKWFWAFMELRNLNIDKMPTFARLAYKHQQNIMVDYNHDHVVKRIQASPAPVLAVNIKVFWSDNKKLPSKYSFQDTLSTPNLRVTNHRVITYRLLDFGDVIVYDDIQGLSGRPTTGILGFLFRVIGEGRVVQSRIAVSNDGLQINYAQAKKGLFCIKETVTVQPNGHTRKGLPEDRPDLLDLVERLKEPLKIKYFPFE